MYEKSENKIYFKVYFLKLMNLFPNLHTPSKL
jgi:hypothetical protein